MQMLFSPHCIVVDAVCLDYMTKDLKGKVHITKESNLTALTKTFLLHSQMSNISFSLCVNSLF